MQLRAIKYTNYLYRIYMCESSIGINEYRYINVEVYGVPQCTMNEMMSPDREPGTYLSEEMFVDELVKSFMELPDSVMEFLFNDQYTFCFRKLNGVSERTNIEYSKKCYTIGLKSEYDFRFHLYYMIGCKLSLSSHAVETYYENIKDKSWKINYLANYLLRTDSMWYKDTQYLNSDYVASDYRASYYVGISDSHAFGLLIALIFRYGDDFKKRLTGLDGKLAIQIIETIITNAKYLSKN